MTAAAFYAVTSGLTVVGTVLEYAWSRRTGKGWHSGSDTLANLNLAAGNLALGILNTAIVLVAYGWLYEARLFDLALPGPVRWGLGFLLAELLQYWNHRISHRWNLLWWGHATHHSSSHLNLSTGVRVNWCYRMLAVGFYLPMPLLGFTVGEFVSFHMVMHSYNLLCHTRIDPPYGPLAWLLVTPKAHRLHHTNDPALFGNYGASLILWDRLFGTFRDVPAEVSQRLSFGIDANVDESDPLRLNFEHLGRFWREARSEGRSFLAVVLSPARTEMGVPAVVPTGTGTSAAAWALLAGVVAIAIAANRAPESLAAPWAWGLVAIALGLTVLYGRSALGDRSDLSCSRR